MKIYLLLLIASQTLSQEDEVENLNAFLGGLDYDNDGEDDEIEDIEVGKIEKVNNKDVRFFKNNSENLVDHFGDEEYNLKNVLNKRKTKYKVNVPHLCPNPPPKQMIKCEEQYNISRYVTMMKFDKDDEKVEPILDLALCSFQQFPAIEISLEIYCFSEGIKTVIKKLNASVNGTNQEPLEKLMEKVTAQLDSVNRPDLEDYFDELLIEVRDQSKSLLEEMATLPEMVAENNENDSP